jgi:sulfatase modifying factor 1
MTFIPPGALVAGTPPDRWPRIADQEMPGEQVVLQGFYIDNFPYPNEDGAIPLTNATQAAAATLCAEQDKRLCSELEWERACKGPNNTTYEYGDVYRADRCGTGAAPALRPSGFRVACRSEFGVRDLHGGVWEWTSSPWGRGLARALATVRGGNAAAGELVGRCANAMGRAPDQESGVIGFRCCAGPKNEAEVTVQIDRGRKLEYRARADEALVKRIFEQLPEDARADLSRPDEFDADRSWVWHPIGNEELFVVGGCEGLGKKPACGVFVVRQVVDAPQVLAWISSGYYVPSVHADTDPRDLWVFGGDSLGNFRRLVVYVWGRVSVGPKERRVPKRPKSTKKSRKR